MNKLVIEVQELTKEILDLKFDILEGGVTLAEAVQVAAQIQQNRILSDAFMLDLPHNEPAALETIVMALKEELNQEG